MSPLASHLHKNYSNAQDIVKVLKDNDVYSLLETVLLRITDKVDFSDKHTVLSNAATFLVAVNNKLAKIRDQDVKQKIEYIIIDIVRPYLDTFFSSSTTQNSLNELKDSLQFACQLHGYDFDKLNSLIQLDRYRAIQPGRNFKHVYYYQWNSKPVYIDELARDIRDKGWISSSAREFSKLFRKEALSSVICNIGYEIELILLFKTLYELRIISPKGISGYMAPFNAKAVDNDGEIYFKIPTNKILDRAKRSSNQLAKKQQVVEKIVRINIRENPRQ